MSAWPTAAKADLSSWLYAGGGLAAGEAGGVSQTRGLLDLHTGMGTDPSWPLGIGGVLKFPIHFTGGLDLGLAARFATRGYNQGGFGVAFDIGGYQRWWGLESTGLSGGLVLGAPWGITLNLGALQGSHDTREFSLSLGIDFARLTAHRTSGSNWWQNIVLPAGPRSEPR
ncbi:MAG TPA: hypothetical protein VHO25_07045 [Polyangiaceae bacterium]|nr:hypothetical protein [Polyangiaceae bacterium]